MSQGPRISRMSVRARGRESIFASSADQYRGDAAAICSPNLRECVLAMEDCAEEVALLFSARLMLLRLTLYIPGVRSTATPSKWHVRSASNE